MGSVAAGTVIAGVPLTTVQTLDNPAIQINEAVIIPSYSGGEISVTLPVTSEGNSIDNISSLSLGAVQYSPGSSVGALEPGEYFFDHTTQQLTVKVATGTNPPQGTAIKYTAVQNKVAVYGDRYRGPIPQFFKDWNVQGQPTFSRSFGQSPSGSLTFTMATNEFKNKVCDLPEGTIINWNGHDYATGQVTSSDDPINNISVVSVSLQGPHDHRLDEQILLRAAGGTLSVSGRNSVKSTVSIPVADLFTRGNMGYSGPSIDIKVAKERDLRDSVSGQELLSYARTGEAFAYLDNASQVEFRTWITGRTQHNLSSSEILNGVITSGGSSSLNSIEVTYNTVGNKDGDRFLAAEYKNTRLDLDESEGSESGDGGRTNVTRVLRSGSAVTETANGNLVSFVAPSGVDRSVHSAHHDNGGPTLDYKVETYTNGILTASTYQKYGYSYKVSDFGVWVDDQNGTISPTFEDPANQPRSQGWGEVENASEQYEHDSDGYLIRSTKTTILSRRYKQETEQRETLKLYALANYFVSSDSTIQSNIRAAYQAALALYDSFEVTEEEVTEYTLESLDDYYPDLPELEDGEPPRKFVARQVTTKRYYYESTDLEAITIEDDGTVKIAVNRLFAGDSTAIDFLDLDGLTISTGEDYERIVETSIIYPPRGISKANYNPQEDHYKSKETLRRATGEGLRNAFEEPSREEEFRGKVQGAQRLELFEDGNQPNVEEDESEENITLLNTPNNGLDPNSDPVYGSVSFPGSYKKAQALAAAKVDISIQNTANVEVWSNVWVPANRQYAMGDVVNYRSEKYVVLSAEESPAIEAPGVLSLDYYVLSWGRYLNPTVTDTDVNNSDSSVNSIPFTPA